MIGKQQVLYTNRVANIILSVVCGQYRTVRGIICTHCGRAQTKTVIHSK